MPAGRTQGAVPWLLFGEGTVMAMTRIIVQAIGVCGLCRSEPPMPTAATQICTARVFVLLSLLAGGGWKAWGNLPVKIFPPMVSLDPPVPLL
jgi:hypothetical protein